MTAKKNFKCPFCREGEINATHFPSVKRYLGGPYGGGKKKIIDSPEDFIVENDCPKCGKTSKEIEKIMKRGYVKERSHEERLKKLRESGLPTLIVNERKRN